MIKTRNQMKNMKLGESNRFFCNSKITPTCFVSKISISLSLKVTRRSVWLIPLHQTATTSWLTVGHYQIRLSTTKACLRDCSARCFYKANIRINNSGSEGLSAVSHCKIPLVL